VVRDLSSCDTLGSVTPFQVNDQEVSLQTEYMREYLDVCGSESHLVLAKSVSESDVGEVRLMSSFCTVRTAQLAYPTFFTLLTA